MIVHIPTIAIPESTGLRRDPPRASEHRQPGYEESFDFDTLIYNAIYLQDKRRVVLVCPPALNLESIWRSARFVDNANPTHSYAFELTNLDRLLRIVVKDVEFIGEGISLEFAGHILPLPIAGDQSEVFSGRSVVFTKSRDNDLRWITDWAEYYAKVHGIDGALIFDNRSTSYSCDDLYAALSTVLELKAVLVVNWPALWGATAGTSGKWDSDFGQHGALEVARWRFLRTAGLVVNADIDELLLPLSNANLKSVCEISRSGLLHFSTRWTVGISDQITAKSVRHRDFVHVLPPGAPLKGQKWAICPQRAKNITQWCTHSLRPHSAHETLSSEFEIRHFREVNTGWKNSRTKRHRSDEPGISRDEKLLETFTRIGWR